ncbi:protein translocase subunit SecF [Myxococcus sp. MISCRS1]|jgi:preprotein translocase subunit SecF|uniref:protein translocase subunit SecF n=1 Tax=Myxococcus TaxID=32 RepID=UPI001CBD3A13|nr:MULTISPECIES: protein translocase subunit SecF [Myxococcus]MBZ4401409.1 protein translocase subunit SecF [Myxococcus sp. AS-1-15]MCK8503565.1 protein translocase subunit SecF [Myxococcus fulvus]MCY1002601.1 protein translocase subunit SecF [Myxococcus sp. MISCRS1]BDT35831.1 protein translocase subunit SecF [Myxococcus sp. MH1]
MQILKNKTNIDFIGKRKPAVFISTLINLAILVGIATVGFNYGVDFAGGTVVELKFDHPVSAAEVRERAEKGGLHDVSVQNIGSASENAFLLRMGGVTQLNEENADKAKAAIEGLGSVKNVYADLANGIINFRSSTPLTAEAIKAAVEKSGTGVQEVRVLGENQGGTGVDYQVVASGMADKVFGALSAGLEKPDFEQRRVDYVGPQVGKQLRNRGVMALLYSMVAILIYVAFRFDFKFGPGALLAMLHDVIMVAGYYLVSRREFNLTAIAALLTIVGYSVNDTIVIYDRIREDMAKFKGKPFAEVINIAINDTLGRTILTAGTTALSLIGLLIFGVGEIFDFAMAMLVGIVVGTYSSVFIASPVTIWLDERAAAKEARVTAPA